MPLPRANRCRVAELAIKHLPRPDGYTTPPPVRPDNLGDPLTPLLQNPLSVRELEDMLIEMNNRLRIARNDLEAAGNAALKEGRFNEAATHFTSAINATPKHYTETASDAMLFLRLALLASQRALESGPPDSE